MATRLPKCYTDVFPSGKEEVFPSPNQVLTDVQKDFPSLAKWNIREVQPILNNFVSHLIYDIYILLSRKGEGQARL